LSSLKEQQNNLLSIIGNKGPSKRYIFIDIAAHFIQFVFVLVVKNIEAWPLQNAIFTMMLFRCMLAKGFPRWNN